jgi:hypothetical protein
MTRYRVWLCGQPECGHPGGQHFLDLPGCLLCDACPGWDNDKIERGFWSDEQQRAAEAAR